MRYYQIYYSGTVPLFRPYDDLQGYLEQNLNGYRASQTVIATLAFNQKKRSRVLAFRCEPLAFYFRKAKIISVGDYFGPARYLDLINEVERGNCRSYLNQFDISAVIVVPASEAWWRSFYEEFRSQLKENQFSEYRCGTDQVPIFLRSDIKPIPELNQVMR